MNCITTPKNIINIAFLVIILFGCMNSSSRKNSESDNQDKTIGFITIDGTKLNYVIEGDGIPCVFIGATKNYPIKTFSTGMRKHIKFIFMNNRAFVPSV